jgi:hypothetical protein
MIDNRQQEWVYQQMDDETKFRLRCEKISVQVDPIKTKQQSILRWVSVTRIRSSTTIQDWKNNDSFYSAVSSAMTYIFPHPFAHDEWDTTSIGFIKNVHSVHYPREVLHNQIYSMLQQQTPTPPVFQLITQRITTKDKKATTKAYTVQCLKQDATQLIHLLTHGPFRTEANQNFVPFKYKSKKPDIFTKCIRQQNEIYHKTWIIKMEGISHDVMDHLRTDIAQIMGVFHIVPTKRIHEIGEWKILADHTKCAYIHRHMTEQWKKLMKKVPQEVLDAAPDHFSVPTISSKRAREHQDSDSDDDSYGSLLTTGTTGTEASIFTADDPSLNDLPTEYKLPSYASATANSYKSGQETAFSSPTNSTYTDWQKEKHELEAQLRSQAAQIEKIQADLQSKISRSKDLEDQLAQALDLAHERDKRHQEMLDKFEQLMNIRTKPADTDNQLQLMLYTPTNTQPSTPDRDNPKVDSPPPPKKANTNASPHRHIYSLFRQPPGKSMTPRQPHQTRQASTKKTMPHISTQPMETDEIPRQLYPGAKPGKKIE